VLEPLVNPLLIAPLLALLIVALITDMRDRRIPNILVLAGLVIGVAGHVWFSGVTGLVLAALGMCVGLLCLLPFYAAGALGAGDVKLMAVCGAFLGPVHVVVAAVAALVVGGVIGIVWLFSQFTSTGSDDPQDDADSISMNSTIPYALAVSAGVIISLMVAPAIALALGKGIA
jgi:Flp pilus assembly protein protease CpaA